MKTLLIGGTGPSGPHIVDVLLHAGQDVTVLHRGTHEPRDAPSLQDVEHIHADPHFANTLSSAMGDRRFDTVIATYGRMSVIVEVFRDRCDRFIGVGGNPLHPGVLDRLDAFPTGMRLLADETDAPLDTADAQTSRQRFAAKVVEAERSVLDAHRDGAFQATYLRYPTVYGRWGRCTVERAVLARLRAGRRRLLLPDGGLAITSRLADRNAAHAVACVLSQPDAAAGQVFQCADDRQFAMWQWVELICSAVGRSAEIVSVPGTLATTLEDLLPTGAAGSPHVLVNNSKIKALLGYADVVKPDDVIADLAQRLWTEASALDGVEFDVPREDELLTALENLHRRFGFDADAARTGTYRHSYDHPPRPAS